MKAESVSRRKSIAICLLLLFVAAGVRVLSWQDNRFEVVKVEWGVTAEYKEGAQLLANGEVSAYLHNLFYMTHPPGYPLLLALLSKVFGNGNAPVQMFQIVCDAAAVVVVFLIVSTLLSRKIGVIAGLLVAISPQLAYYPSLLLPDSVSVLPILLAVYCLILAQRRPRLFLFALAGVSVGASCWLRANMLLLTPFLAVLILLLFSPGKRLRFASILILGTLLTIAPITIKNFVVFRQFIPLSLGSGQKLLEGIAEYDRDGRFGIPKTDRGIVLQEAELYHRPDYLGGLFVTDGVHRDRLRVARAFSVFRAHPFWYLGVMGRRALTFPRLARVPSVSSWATYSHSLDVSPSAKPNWTVSPQQMLSTAAVSAGSKVAVSNDGQALFLIGNDSKKGEQISFAPITVLERMDYVLRVPISLEEGRVMVAVTTPQQRPLYWTIIEPPEGLPATAPGPIVNLPFATGSAAQVQLILSNAGSTPRAQIKTIEMLESGPTAYRWTRYLRTPIHFFQLPFITACMLPLALAGIVLLVWKRKYQALAFLLIVPVYYLCVQSALHTERRYVIAIHYFLFALGAVPIVVLIEGTWLRAQVFARRFVPFQKVQET